MLAESAESTCEKGGVIKFVGGKSVIESEDRPLLNFLRK
jgi:hypothetical protein